MVFTIIRLSSNCLPFSCLLYPCPTPAWANTPIGGGARADPAIPVPVPQQRDPGCWVIEHNETFALPQTVSSCDTCMEPRACYLRRPQEGLEPKGPPQACSEGELSPPASLLPLRARNVALGVRSAQSTAAQAQAGLQDPPQGTRRDLETGCSRQCLPLVSRMVPGTEPPVPVHAYIVLYSV